MLSWNKLYDNINKYRNVIYHSIPKCISFLYTCINIPKKSTEIPSFISSVLIHTLFIHTISPNKTQVPLSIKDKCVILINLLLTKFTSDVFIRSVGDRITNVSNYNDINIKEALYPVLWVLVHEIYFFNVHRILHQPFIYRKCHKMHHKFKVTSVFTSFYSHVFDHLFAVILSVVIGPFLQMYILDVSVSTPVISIWFASSLITFISSHHTIIGDDDITHGTEHFIHHQKSQFNLGNFGYLDKLLGTHDYYNEY